MRLNGANVDRLNINVLLTNTALRLRSLRMQSGLSLDEVSIKSKISKIDILSFEMDKKIPTKNNIRQLEKIYLKEIEP